MNTTNSWIAIYSQELVSEVSDQTSFTTNGPPPFFWEASVVLNIPASLPWYILAVVTILTNGLVLISFAKEKRLRTYINYYVINLAIADFSVGMVVIPTYSVIVMLGWYWPFFGFYGCKIFQGVSYALVTVSILSVIAIAIDRFYATVSPIHYYSYRRKRNAIRISVLCWIISFGIWIPFNTLWPIFSKEIPRLHTFCGPDYGRSLVTTLVAICILFWFPVILLVVLNSRVYYEVIKSGQLSVNKSFGDEQTTDCETLSSKQLSTSHMEVSVVYSLSGSGVQNSSYFNDENEDTSKVKIMTTQLTGKHSPDPISDVGDILVGVAEDGENVGENGEVSEVPENPPAILRGNDNAVIKRTDGYSGATRDYQHQQPFGRRVVPSSPIDVTSRVGMTSVSDEGTRTVDDGKTVARTKESVKESVKAFRILSAVVLSYILSWAMFGVIVVIISVCMRVIQEKCTSTRIDLIAQYLSFCNSLINPICYAAVQPLFKKTILRMFTK